MKMFSDCSGECCVCACSGGCAAGHGDDDFELASKEQLIDRLEKVEYKSYTEYMMMIDVLNKEYKYDYEKKKIKEKVEYEKVRKAMWEVFREENYPTLTYQNIDYLAEKVLKKLQGG